MSAKTREEVKSSLFPLTKTKTKVKSSLSPLILSPLIFVFWTIFSTLNLWAVTETTTAPNACGSEYAISGLDGISTSSSSTNYYVGSYSNTTQTIYLKFTPSIDGNISMSEGIGLYNSSTQVKFYVGTTCGSADIVSSNANSTTHGPFFYPVVAGNTYYVEVLKKDKNYMRYSLTYTFTAPAINYVTTDETVPTTEANATTAVCGSFQDVLQTRNDPSNISHVAGASADIYNSTDCTLNTGVVDFGTSQHLYCNGGNTTATGTYGTKLNLNYVNEPVAVTISAIPSASDANKTVTSAQTLVSSEYNKVEVDSGSSSLAIDFSALRFINTLNLTSDNTVTFNTPTPYNLEIGSVGIANNGSGNSFTTTTIPKNIKINPFSLPGNTSIDFEAEQTIKMETLEIGRAGTSILLKAPYVQINSLHQTNSSSGASTVEIHADYVDIGNLALDQEATIIIKPYTVGKRVLFRANSITASSSSTMIVDSGNYYTTSFDIPGSSDVSSIHASDNNQLINFYINGDFRPGNDPGINSTGNNGNFGTLPPKNFMFFVSGDLETGGGGTTFNATVYVEGSVNFGSPSYLKGALSSGGDILIGNNSQFTYDQNIGSNGWGSCAGGGSSSFSTGFVDAVDTYSDVTYIDANGPDIKTKISNKGGYDFDVVYLGSDHTGVETYSPTGTFDTLPLTVEITLSDATCSEDIAPTSDGAPYGWAEIVPGNSFGTTQTPITMPALAKKDAKLKFKALDWNSLFNSLNVSNSCKVSSTHGSLCGVPACLGSSQQANEAFPPDGNITNETILTQCYGLSADGSGTIGSNSPCNTSNYNGNCGGVEDNATISPSKYSHRLGCLACIVGALEQESTCSIDNFAIRPDAFRVFGQNQYKLAGEDFNVTIKAVDEVNNALNSGTVSSVTGVSDYNVSLNYLNITSNFYQPSPGNIAQMQTNTGLVDVTTCPNTGVFTVNNSSDLFANGEVNASLKFSETGILDLNISEIPGQEWALVDANDTNDTLRYIQPATVIYDEGNISATNILLFIPYKFDTTAEYNTTNAKNWLYIHDINGSNISFTTPKMAAFIKYTITAKNKDGNITHNYTKTCFPDTTESTPYNPATDCPQINGLKMNATFDLFLDADINSTADANISLYTEDNNSNAIYTPLKNKSILAGNTSTQEQIFPASFESGVGEAKVYFNIDRNASIALNPIRIGVIDVNTSTSWMANPGSPKEFNGSDINQSKTFYYGRVHAPDQRFATDHGTAKIYYEVYYDTSNAADFNIDGNESIDSINWYTNTLHTNNDGNVSDYNSSDNVKFGSISYITATPTQDNTANITNGVEPIILVAPSTPYKDKINMNSSPWLIYNPTDFLVEFYGKGGWAGQGIKGKTVDLNISKKQNRRLDW